MINWTPSQWKTSPLKDSVKTRTTQTIAQEEICLIHTAPKRLILRICRELLQLSSKKTSELIKDYQMRHSCTSTRMAKIQMSGKCM